MSYQEDLDAYKQAIGVTKPPPPKREAREAVQQHLCYPYIGTSDRQRAYLVKHGIPHQRKGGEFY